MGFKAIAQTDKKLGTVVRRAGIAFGAQSPGQ